MWHMLDLGQIVKRLRTDYIDYYLMHHMTAINQWDKLYNLGIRVYERFGIEKRIRK